VILNPIRLGELHCLCVCVWWWWWGLYMVVAPSLLHNYSPTTCAVGSAVCAKLAPLRPSPPSLAHPLHAGLPFGTLPIQDCPLAPPPNAALPPSPPPQIQHCPLAPPPPNPALPPSFPPPHQIQHCLLAPPPQIPALPPSPPLQNPALPPSYPPHPALLPRTPPIHDHEVAASVYHQVKAGGLPGCLTECHWHSAIA
jgi:hypothetical protein